MRSLIEQNLVPFAVNTAGAVEGGLERASISARNAPVASMLAALGTGCLLAYLTAPRRSRR